MTKIILTVELDELAEGTEEGAVSTEYLIERVPSATPRKLEEHLANLIIQDLIDHIIETETLSPEEY